MFSNVWKKGTCKNCVPDFESKYKVSYILPFLWIEHCVECTAPLCYSTCKIFRPRTDGRCLRFESGVHPIIFHDNTIGGQVSFRQWAKLEGIIAENFESVPIGKVQKIGNVINKIGISINTLLVKTHIKWHGHRPNKSIESALALFFLKKRFPKSKSIDGFLICVYNHEYESRNMFMEIVEGAKTVFKHSFILNHGWLEEMVPLELMPINPNKRQCVRFYLEGITTGTFTFKYLDFVTLEKTKLNHVHPATKVKCVAWDLDNTLWKGVIGDSVNNNVSVFEESTNLIKELDKRGILQTIVSKNTFEIAWNKIKELNLEDYFLYPAINWGRKSQNLLSISKELNINIDTFALIDDSAFERNEVSQSLPQVRVYDVTEVSHLLERAEFDVPITEESLKRRLSYIIDGKRKIIKASYGENYDSFLRDCNMHIVIFQPYTNESKERCIELLQRSNQYNIANVKRDVEGFNALCANCNFKLFAIKVYDKFGDYGIVGFASIEKITKNKFQLRDFVMSCRVAQKKVERAFFTELVKTLNIGNEFVIELHKTDRNKPLQAELMKMPFNVDENNEMIVLKYIVQNDNLTKDDIITVHLEKYF